MFRNLPCYLLSFSSRYGTAGYGYLACCCTWIVSIWLSIGMTPHPGIYRRLGKPVHSTTALIDGHQFISLWTPTKSAIPAHAWDFQEAQHRLLAFSATGVPKAIDWGTFPDWFDLTVHWRGYTPENAVTDDWWHTLSEYIVKTGESFGIKEKIVEWRSNRIQHLRQYI